MTDKLRALLVRVVHGTRVLTATGPEQVGSNDDNGSGGGYAYRASKAALNISALSISRNASHCNMLSGSEAANHERRGSKVPCPPQNRPLQTI